MQIIINYSDMTVSDSDVIIKSCLASFSHVGWLLTVGSLATRNRDKLWKL